MKGIEISKAYFEAYGRSLIDQFPQYRHLLAAGLCGSGSECYGYDDEISRDHDFEPGFLLFVKDDENLSEQELFQIEKAYLQLPKEFMGIERAPVSPVGGSRHGVIRLSAFLKEKTGNEKGELSKEDWLHVPSDLLIEAVNGEIFYDPFDIISSKRKELSHYPADIRRKRLAGELLVMAQSGQYNYERCIRHNEREAAQLYVSRFVKASLEAVFLINDSYMPYDKWVFRALKSLEKLDYLKDPLNYLLTTPNTEAYVTEKQQLLETICTLIQEEVRNTFSIKEDPLNLEDMAYLLNDTIQDAELRNLHILSGV